MQKVRLIIREVFKQFMIFRIFGIFLKTNEIEKIPLVTSSVASVLFIGILELTHSAMAVYSY